jgi:flagellar biosynthesis protein FliR
MKLSAPKQITFWIAVVVVVLGILGKLVPGIPVITNYATITIVIGFIILALGNLLDQL